MPELMDRPLTVFLFALVVLWIAAQTGAWLRRRHHSIDTSAREDLNVILAAALTLLALVIGFTFSMALGRYDLRKTYEEAEANVIGTEYVRTEMLPSADAVRIQALLRDYIDSRILFYETSDPERLRQIDARTTRLHTELWSSIVPVAVAQPTPITALVAAGMNDVLNSQGYAQAAWWNRIPLAAWALLGTIAVSCNLLVGYCARSSAGATQRHVVLPFVLAVAVALIADIEAPRGGGIVVAPQNLIALKSALPAH